MLTKKKQAAVGLCLVGSLLFLADGCGRSGPNALLEGKRRLDRGEPVNALRELREAVSLMPTNPMAWGYLGLAYQESGSFTNAVQAYHRSLALKPDLAEVRFNLGCLWREQKQWARAREELAAATAVWKDSAVAWRQLGEVEVRLGEYDAAVRSLGKALRLDENDADAWNWLGVAQWRQGRVQDAARSFQAALHLQTNHGPALLNLAILTHEKLNNPRRALELYRQYLAFLPNAANAGKVRHLVEQLEVTLRSTQTPTTVASKLLRTPRRTAEPEPKLPAARPPAHADEPTVVAPPSQPEPQPRRTIVQTKPVLGSAAANTSSNVEPPPSIPKPVDRSNVLPTIAPVVETSAPNEPLHSTELSPSEPKATAEAAPKKQGFFSKINPLNLFKSKSGKDQPAAPPSGQEQRRRATETNAP